MDRYNQAYKRVQACTADRGSLLLLLLDRTVAELGRAREDLSSGIPGWEHHLLKGKLGVVELDRTLNHEAGPELAVALHKLYLHVLWLLVEALESRDPKPLARAERLVLALRETWCAALRPSGRVAS